MSEGPVIDQAAYPPRPAVAELTPRLEEHRVELTGFAYRMLGSAFEAEDAVQETFIRAWRSYDRFEGRSSLRTWLYRIATNVCLSMLSASQRRARPMDMAPAGTADTPFPAPLPDSLWVEPVPDRRVVPDAGDPAERAVQRESIRLAFVAALQHLPPRQRAVLILREVLHWRASEVAELLETSVQAVNSALQRARATLASADPPTTEVGSMDTYEQALLARYVDAFERYDMDALTALLREDATWSMPPHDLWLQTHEDIRHWCLGPGIGCQGSRLVAVEASGSAAFGQYKPAPGGGHEAWALQVLELSDDGISGIAFFLDTARMFPLFDLPLRLEE